MNRQITYPFLLALVALLAAILLSAFARGEVGEDPLPSWHNRPAKSEILEFVQRVTTEGSPDFVAPAERVAVFDNDGTLWGEQPMYVQLAFAVDRIKALAAAQPELAAREPFKSVLAGDLRAALAGGEKSILQLVMASHSGMTVDEFRQTVVDWIQTARHPRTGRRYLDMVYQPQLELLAFLRANDFQTFVVSGGGIDFIRPWVEQAYGIPPHQVIGSSGKLAYEVRDGVPVVMKLAEVDFVDDGPGKPVGIHLSIGRRPILAFGNSDGDFEMLEYVTAGPGARLGLILHHDDGERENAYDRESHVGRLDRALDEAAARGWVVVSMASDFASVFPPAPAATTVGQP